MSIAKFSSNRPIAVAMLFSAILIIGIISIVLSKVELLPSYDIPHLVIVTNYPGAPAEEIEKYVTEPIEEGLSSTERLKNIYSKTIDGMSIVHMEFYWKTDMDFTILKVREKLDRMKWNLPSGVERSNILDYNPSNKPIMSLVFTGSNDIVKLTSIAEDLVSKRLEQITGVAMVKLLGKSEEEVAIIVDKNKIKLLDLDIESIAAQIKQYNSIFSGGQVKDDQLIYSINFQKSIENIDDIKNLLIINKNNYKIKLSELAEIKLRQKPQNIIAHWNGKNSIILDVIKGSGANSVEIIREIKKFINEWNKKNDVKIEIIEDDSVIINTSISSVIQAIIGGGFLAFLSLFWFLKDLKSPITVSLSIPFSILLTFSCIYFNRISLNMLSLSGLAIGIGMLVDNSVIVLENISQLREKGYKLKDSVIKGTEQVMLSIVAGTLTTIIVFLPIVYLQGPVAIFFKEQALTITYSLFASLLVAITIVPAIFAQTFTLKEARKPEFNKYSLKKSEKKWLYPILILYWLWKLLKNIIKYCIKYTFYLIKKFFLFCSKSWNKAHNKFFARILELNSEIIDKFTEKFEKTFKKALEIPEKIVFSFIIIFIISLILLKFINKAFLPSISPQNFIINIENATGSDINSLENTIRIIEEYLSKDKRIESFQSIAGQEYGDNLMIGDNIIKKENIGYIIVNFSNKNKKFIKDISKNIYDYASKNLKGTKVTIKMGQHLYSNIFEFSDYPLSIKLQGIDENILYKVGEEIKEKIKNIDGIEKVESDLIIDRPIFKIDFKDDKLKEIGITKELISEKIKAFTQAVNAGNMSSGTDKKSILIYSYNYNLGKVPDIEELMNYGIKIRGTEYKISDFITYERSFNVNEINHFRGLKAVTLNVKPVKKLNNKINQSIMNILDFYKDKYKIKYFALGERQEINNSFKWLFFALILSIVLVYLVLGVQFESYYLPLIIILDIPLTLIGVSFGLFFTGTSLNIISFIGIIILVGISVNDSILKIDTIEYLRRKENYGLKEAIMEASRIRLRPILMTSLTTIVGLIPLALGIGSGSELSQPLGITMITGLISSVFLTLYLIPIVYYLLERNKE